MIDIFNHPRRKPDRRTRTALKLEDWPAEDHRRWGDAFKSGGVFNTGAGAHLVPPTKASWENEYGTWLAFLQRSGPAVLDDPLASRVTRDRIVEYCRVLAQTNSSYSIASRVQKLRHALRLLAPEVNWEWLLIIGKRIKSRAGPRPKGPRYQDIAKLNALGFKLMEDAKRRASEEVPIRFETALTFRDGLIIALEAATLLRRRNLAQMTIGRQLIQTGLVPIPITGRGVWLWCNGRNEEPYIGAERLLILPRWVLHFGYLSASGPWPGG
jgi:hypothetical protein